MTKSTRQEYINLITLNAIRTLVQYTSDESKIGGYGIDIQDVGKGVKNIEIKLSYWEHGHPFNKSGDTDD